MAVARYLADKSALARLSKPEVGDRLSPLLADGAVATCGIVMVEVLFSARSSSDHTEIKELLGGLERVLIGEAAFDRALEVQERLAERGEHRGAVA